MPQRPYGNDFLVATPALQNLEQRLYVEEKQRQQQNINNAKALDDEFSKNVSSIRDADIDDLTKAYQDYKQSTQATMRQKDGVSPQQQMEVLRKKAAMYKLINESKAEREREELIGKRYTVKPDDFNDNAAELLIKGRQLPIEKKRAYKTVGADGKETIIDLTNPENILWQDKTNWQPILQKAGGTLAQRGQPVIVDLPGGLEQEITTYKGGNDPVEYFQSIIGAMNTPRASQSLAARYNFTPEEAQDIMMKFEELKKTPAFKNAYGDVKFPESAGISQGGKTAMLLAMANAINNPPTETKTKRTDLAKVKDRNFKEWKEKNDITSAQAYQRALIARQGATSGYSPTSGNAFDEIPDMDMQSGKKIVNGTVYNPDGTPYSSPSGAGDIFIPKNKLPSSVLTSLKAAGVDPSQIGEGVNISVKDGVITTMETKRNGVISRQNMENYQKAFNKEPMKSAQPSFGKPVFQPTQTTNKSKGGGVPEKVERKYSKDELLKGGWTQDQINKAVKAGKIKLK